MRILIASPDFPDSFADNVKATLGTMGHEVAAPLVKAVPGRSTLWGAALRVATELAGRATADRPSWDDLALLKAARTFRPDLLLALTYQVHPEVLAELGGSGLAAKRVLWWGDAPANSRRWDLTNPGWDHVYVKDPDAVAKLALIRDRISLLHEAMNPMWHRVLARRTGEQIVVAGNCYGFRQAIMLRLAQDGVAIDLHGPRPPRWASDDARRLWSGQYLVREAKSTKFGEALACLNTFHLAEGNSLNCRAFEIAGAGGLQLIEHRPAIAECFEPGRELVVFRTYEELREAIHWANRAPDEAAKVREAGARRALSEHTYRHRLQRILDDLAT